MGSAPLLLTNSIKNPPPYGGGFYYLPTKLAAKLTELTSSGGDKESGIGDDIANGEVS